MYHTRLQVICNPQFVEILIAEVADVGFETFMETENGFEAYVTSQNFDNDRLNAIKERYLSQTPITFRQDQIEKKNWNEEWEKNYEPVIVNNKCIVRAHFHKVDKAYPLEIIITPKMSFGTGHHQTTYLMLKNQMELSFTDKRVMDAGCGTAILSIAASKLGAKEIEAFDIDEWSVINGKENLEINQCKNVSISQAAIEDLTFTDNFDIVLANINKNILTQNMKDYARYLLTGGKILLSGFYSTDVIDLIEEASRHGLRELQRDERDSWAALLLEKII